MNPIDSLTSLRDLRSTYPQLVVEGRLSEAFAAFNFAGLEATVLRESDQRLNDMMDKIYDELAQWLIEDQLSDTNPIMRDASSAISELPGNSRIKEIVQSVLLRRMTTQWNTFLDANQLSESSDVGTANRESWGLSSESDDLPFARPSRLDDITLDVP